MRIHRSFVVLLVQAAVVYIRMQLIHVQDRALATQTRTDWSLRLDWTSLPPITSLAQRIMAVQTRCTPPKKVRRFCHQNAGLGSNFHTWAQALCVAMEHDAMMITETPWKWMDEGRCPDEKLPMSCYFGPGHLPEEGQRNSSDAPASNMSLTVVPYSVTVVPYLGHPSTCLRHDKNHLNSFGRRRLVSFEECPSFMNRETPVHEFMAAAMEYLFQSVKPVVIAEAERQAQQAFPLGLPDPENLITVHMRWGDKATELGSQLPAESYVRGVEHIVKERRVLSPVHIYLASEDSAAITAFTDLAPKHWQVHTSGPTQEGENKDMLDFRSGANGLSSLGALLLSLQSNHYLLATTSNWSRLINELRSNILDPRCENCTFMIDLHPGQWPRQNKNGRVINEELWFGNATVLGTEVK